MTKHTDTRLSSRFPAMLPATMLLFATASCVSDPAELDPAWLADVDLTPVAPAGDQWNSCTTWDCGKNHPMLNLFPLHDLHEGGDPNDDGYYILNVWRFGQPLTLEVENGVMTGTSGQGDKYTGHNLLGSIITVRNQSTNEVWQIQIHALTTGSGLPYWAGGGFRPAYHLRYRAFGTRPWENLCNEPLPSDDLPWPEGYETYAFLIDDERYDRDAKKALAEDAEGWFNIACAGSTLAKMVLMHYDPNVKAVDPYRTTPAQRTAVLKMLTADYLGTGEPFTEGGVRLEWADTFVGHQASDTTSPEAVWDQFGAVCLEAPRLLTRYTDYWCDLHDACPSPDCTLPPSCSALNITDDNWQQYGMWRTWTPPQ